MSQHPTVLAAVVLRRSVMPPNSGWGGPVVPPSVAPPAQLPVAPLADSSGASGTGKPPPHNPHPPPTHPQVRSFPGLLLHEPQLVSIDMSRWPGGHFGSLALFLKVAPAARWGVQFTRGERPAEGPPKSSGRVVALVQRLAAPTTCPKPHPPPLYKPGVEQAAARPGAAAAAEEAARCRRQPRAAVSARDRGGLSLRCLGAERGVCRRQACLCSAVPPPAGTCVGAATAGWPSSITPNTIAAPWAAPAHQVWRP